MRLDVPLNGSMAEEMDDEPGGGKPHARKATKRVRDREAAADFLENNPTAKIVVVLDTHCLEETGAFIYNGDTPDSYESCHMVHVSISCIAVTCGVLYLTCMQIISECIPRGVHKFLSNSEGTPPHNHKSIIFNLACGASIRNAESRYSLFEG